MDITGCTFGGSSTYGLRNWAAPASIKNSLFVDNNSGAAYGDGFYTATNNSFDSSSFGSNKVTYNNDLKYILRVESNSNRYGGGESGAHVGAHIVKRLGTSGRLWGETGWNSLTNENLWPWPYETEIRDWFRTSNNPPAGASPSSNNTKRGFCADGQTLTKYIWEYIGYSIPDEIYEGGLPGPVVQAPKNLRIVQ